MPQTTVSAAPAKGLPGQLVDADNAPRKISTLVDEAGGIEPGLCVVRSPSEGDFVARLPPTFSADDDAILAATATSAGSVDFTGGTLGGVIGAGRIYPPSRLDLTLSNHADFDATNWALVYEDEHGVRQEETFVVPNGGNTVLRTKGYASKVVSLNQPAQSGTGGSFKLGTTTDRAIGKRDALGLSLHSHKALVDPSSSDNELYEDEDVMPVLREGPAWVTVENTFVAGDHVYVRCVAAGAEKRGAIRAGDSDSGDCARWTEARLLSSGSAGELGKLELNV